jgi:asparagine synthase (glutamine-hydrolysing)
MQISNVTLRAARELGIKPLLHLGAYRLMVKAGWLRRQNPIFAWDSKPLGQLLKVGIPTSDDEYLRFREGSQQDFFFNSNNTTHSQLKSFHETDIKTAISQAELVLEGTFMFFGDEPFDLGFPPAWNSFGNEQAASDYELETNSHWTQYNLSTFPSDVKYLWELSRFNWAFQLGRAFLLTNDPRFAEGFWELIESWRGANTPNAGPQWISAQEAAIRILALIFSYYAFFKAFRSRPERISTLVQMIAIHTERIPSTVNYSRAQGNNHLLLEAVALYSVGILFPEFEKSEYWRKRGKEWFLEAISDQVFSDGGYVQHSVNYHRFVLAASLWFYRLAEINNEEYAQEVRGAIGRLADCLSALVDPISGRTTNFGHNDGAILFPLTTCSFHDYRPIMQLAYYVLGKGKSLSPGPWDELPLWFGLSLDKKTGRDHESSETAHVGSFSDEGSSPGSAKDQQAFPQAGLYLIGGEESWGMLRCAEFSNRPGHSDQLHLSLRWRGENVLLDPGTYLYNGNSPWRNSLTSTLVHNAPVVDEGEAMDRSGTFLWLNWSKGVVRQQLKSSHGTIELITAKHDGYRGTGISVLRSVIRTGDRNWHIIDEIIGMGTHSATVAWLLPDAAYEMEGGSFNLKTGDSPLRIEISGPGTGLSIYRAGERIEGDYVPRNSAIMGWYSPTYSRKDPALHLIYNVSGSLPIRISTKIILGRGAQDDAEIHLTNPGESDLMVRSVAYKGEKIET